MHNALTSAGDNSDFPTVCPFAKKPAEANNRDKNSSLSMDANFERPNSISTLKMCAGTCPRQMARFSDSYRWLYWRRSGAGHWVMTCKIRRARLQKAKKAITEWCRRHRHESVGDQHVALKRRLQGHFNYFGARGNQSCLNLLLEHVKRTWFKWLNRRSQRKRLNWQRFNDILRGYPLPPPRASFSLWGATP